MKYGILIIAAVICCVYSSERRIFEKHERSPKLRKEHLNIRQPTSCFDAFQKCRESTKCRTALLGLNSRCKVISGRCASKMVDLPRCGQIMDYLFQYGFSSDDCECEQESEECKSMKDKIYKNPCFASIRHLRKYDLFPKEITAYDVVSGYEMTTTKSPKIVKSSSKHDKLDQLAIFEKVFIGKKVTNPSIIKRITSFASDNKHNSDTSNIDVQSRITEETDVLKIEHSTPRTVSITPSRELKSSEKTETLKYSENASKNKYLKFQLPQEWEEDGADYKIIAIILGVLLGLLIFSSIIFLIWMRITKSYFQTEGKLIQVEIVSKDRCDGSS